MITLAAALCLALAAAPPGGITHARLESRSAASGLAETMTAVQASQRGPFWTGWSVPGKQRAACCWSSREERCRCRLEAEDEGVVQRSGSEPRTRETVEAGPMRVLLRVRDGRVQRVRAFSSECELDFGDLALVWLDDVRPAESVAWLEGLAGSGDDDEGATMAIAFHTDASADAALERFVASGQPSKRRRQAAFWLGVARGERGYLVLSRLLREDGDAQFREHVVFALSQSRVPGAVERIIVAARRDPSAGVRSQALFWLAQSAAQRATKVIQAALDDDPEIEVKRRAVFALSQLPRDEGVPLLMGLARNHRNVEVRKQAMFWLGQSGDPRALAFFEDVLLRRSARDGSSSPSR